MQGKIGKNKIDIPLKKCIICGILIPRHTKLGENRTSPKQYIKAKYCSNKCRGIDLKIINKGKKPTLGKRWKLTEAQKAKRRGKPSGSKGKHWKLSDEQKMKQKGIHIGMTGKHHSEETKKKIRNANKGEKCYLWKGGISFESYSTDWTKTLKQSIRERDKYTCQLCYEKQGDEALSIHHIDYNKKNCNPSNLITLCRKCHTKTNHNRQYWLEYFNNLININI